jgi:predicted ATPase/DNA-binding CsgD family transcriptional regulator
MATTSMRRADNLPAELSRIVGRRAESAALRRLLSDSRLVTLTGVGGVGKTRLAVHVARQVRSAFPDGVCLVMLADLATPGLLPTAVMSAASRGLRAGAGIAELADELAERQLLLVLDNCEHLAAACADLVTTLLRRCPGLRVLTTSRERLRVEGEAVFAVPPLSVPAEGQHLELSDLTRYEALALFVERASAVHRDESSADLDAESVATMCRRLDGLPLAIELMAGRAATLPVKTLTERADDRFRLLTGGSRSAPPRHQTLWAAVDYSYALCSEPARLLWSRMSSFVGGATLDSVRDVCADSALPAADVEAALTELVEKSVVVFNGHRYQMLETLREYGRERLHERVEEISIQVAHLDHFAGLAADPVSGACRSATKARMTSLLVEHANLRAALEFSLRDRAHRARGLRMASSLWQFWFGCGLQREGRHWLGELLTDFEEPCLERMTALWVDGFLAAVDGDHGYAVQRADLCADLAKRLGDQSGIAHATYVRALAILFRGQTNEALPMLEKAVGLLRTVPGSNPVLGASLLSLGIAACLANELELATAALTEGHDLSRASGEELQESWIRVWLGVPALLDGRHDEAVDTFKAVLADNRSIDDMVGMNFAVEFLAWAAMDAGDNERAAELLGISQALAEPVGHLAGAAGLRLWHEVRVADLVSRLGIRSFDEAVERGQRRSVQDGLAFALEESLSPAKSPVGHDTSPLTRREREVASLVAQGMSNKEIAAQLVISQRTAETHVEHILTKLGFNSRTQIVAMFARDVPSPSAGSAGPWRHLVWRSLRDDSASRGPWLGVECWRAEPVVDLESHADFQDVPLESVRQQLFGTLQPVEDRVAVSEQHARRACGTALLTDEGPHSRT